MLTLQSWRVVEAGLAQVPFALSDSSLFILPSFTLHVCACSPVLLRQWEVSVGYLPPA